MSAQPARRPLPPSYRPPVARPRPAGATRRRPVAASAAPPPRTRLRRIGWLTFAFVVLPVVVSLLAAVARPSNVPATVRVVEWMRDHGAAGLVSKVEQVYYSMSAPATGGAALHALPQVGSAAAAAAAAAARAQVAPPAIAPVISPALPGEGVWHGTGRLVRGAPPVLVTTYRPDPNYPQLVAGVAWIDRSRAWLQLYPGRYEPPNAGAVAAQVPTALRGGLLATFNSGFKLEDAHGGFVALGHVYAPLRPGMATLVRGKDGVPDVRAWTGGAAPGPAVEFARQNLRLIVDHGVLNPNLSDGPEWGATLGNAIRVWRSGVGVDARGNLLYAAADTQTVASLARILQRAGAVRAMELDINYEWTTFNFYGGPDGTAPAKLLPGMSRSTHRYLTPDDRDFIAVFARNG